MLVRGNGGWWIVTADDPGGFGFWYSDLREAVKRWNVDIVHYDGRFFAKAGVRS